MMRSLWSGVSGLQAHQIAIDVEGNNIANVNTSGFKYSRANFSDLLSQTQKIATPPQGSLGGTNEGQIGVGSKINSTTRIFQQGASVSTGKITDIAIQGDGFFVLSSDDGATFKYSRNGNFSFDANGNFVNDGGNKVQGWVKDLNPNTSKGSVTSTKVDSSGPIQTIQVEPALRIPAKSTEKVEVRVNLNSGSLIHNKTPVYTSSSKDGYLFSRNIRDLKISKDPAGFVNERELYYTGNQKGQITNFNSQGYKIGSEFAVTTNEDGKFYNLQTATGKKGEINGQGFVLSVSDGSTPVKTFYYEVRYTDGDVLKGHPKATNIDPSNGSLKQSVIDNQDLVSNKYVLKDDPAETPHDTKVVYFRTDQELRLLVQALLRDPGQDGTQEFNANVHIDTKGKIIIENNNKLGGGNINLDIEAIEDKFTTSNVLFTQTVSPLKGLVEPSQTRESSAISTPSHAASINLYDSLGGRHALRIEFQKVSTSEWTWKASVPEPASLVGGVAPDENILRGGTVTFTRNGALKSYSPPNIIFNPNKGSQNGQVVQIDFGSLDGFNGLTHLDKVSSTAGIKQNGFTGGSLVGTRIDETGTIIGNFSNDRAFALAKISMASFINNIGLSSASGNLFAETANSGKPIIGVANSGGRGSIESSRLEASNVDLTKSLTQLIVIQRGFQANSKTVTTSDQMLNTLLQMKQ